MCRAVAIHDKIDQHGYPLRCKTQNELLHAMSNGIWFVPPIDYAFWAMYCQDRYIDGHHVPAIPAPEDWSLIERHGFNPGTCLCPVDIVKTAGENGYICSEIDELGEPDCFDYHFYKKGVK